MAVPPPPPLAQVCKAPVAATALRLQTTDGVSLYAALLGTGRVGLVLGAQHYGTACEWLPEAKRLAADGYRVIVFDYRNLGHSQTTAPALDRHTDRDVVAAAAALRARGATKIVLVGSVLSAIPMLDAAAEIAPAVSGLVAIAPPDPATVESDSVVPPSRAAYGVRLPILVFAGQVALISPALTMDFFRRLTSPAKQLVRLRGFATYGVDVLRNAAAEQTLLHFVATATGRR